MADGDKAEHLIWALTQAFDEGAEWICLANDHTFIIPENLVHYLESFPDPEHQSHWVGHSLKEGGDTGATFLSG